MVIVLLLLAISSGLMLPTAAFGGQPAFYLTIENPRVEYGKALVVSLHARDSKPSLGTLNLSPLGKNFVVETPNGIQNDAARRSQSWRIRLYPRRPDRLRIPALTFLGVKTSPISVEVAPAQGRRDKTPIRVTSSIGDTNVWVGQPVRVTVQVTSDYPFALLGTAPVDQDGIVAKALPFTQRTVSIDGLRRTQYRIGWVLYPQTAGTFALQLPAVKYNRDGIVTRRFFPPKIELHVRALPAFVPPTMPIGHMTVETSLPHHPFLIEHEASYLKLRIETRGIPTRQAWQVLSQFKDIEAVTFYPPERLSGHGGGAADDAHDVLYRIPFMPRAMGLITLPSIRLQYFDPSTGKIVTRIQPLGEVLSVSRWVLYAALIGLLAGVSLLAGLAYRWGKTRWTLYRAYRNAWVSILHAQTPEDMKAGLMMIARAESWTGRPTLAAWLNHWLKRYSKLTSGTDSVLLLQECLYDRIMTPEDEIRSGLTRLCVQRMPLLKAMSLIRVHTAASGEERPSKSS